MRQLQAKQFGSPEDVLEVVDAQDPPLAPGEVRLECQAVGLNFLDVMLCRGDYPGSVALPVTPGVEVVGRVVETCPPTSVRSGDMVLACPTIPRGALGDHVVVDGSLTVPAPPDADPVVLAALPVTYQTAWFALRRARVRAGETVLVHAGAGGVGIAATQLAKAFGAKVIATAGGAVKIAVCLDQGAVAAVDTSRQDFVPVVRDLTAGRGADVVIDPVGGDLFDRSLQCIAFEGRVVPIGSAAGRPTRVDSLVLNSANVSVIGLSWGSAYPQRRPGEVRAAYNELFAMLGKQVRPVIDRVVDLESAPLGLRDLGARKTIGKIVVLVRNSAAERGHDGLTRSRLG